MLNDIDGDFRIRFMTSHPKDCTKELIETMAQCDKVAEHLHLPFQSGSNRVLKAMNRHYTSESVSLNSSYVSPGKPTIISLVIESSSPMMAQYFEVKSKYPDTILFFRVGDFYEMFFDDAKLASSELDLVLTGKDCGQEERAPMCGVPFHSADNYIAKLVSHGHKVAICEQTEDPSKATGLVKRDVIRVMTPGTVIESNMLDDGANNYLCAIYKNF